MDAGAIRFPALWSNQGLVYMIDTLDTMSQCTRAGFKSGGYRAAFLIDSDYHKFEVVDARKLRTLFSFSMFDLLGLLEGNPRWQVELVLGPPKKSSLAEAKQLISNSFKKEKDSWEEMMDFEEFRDRVVDATSMEEIFTAFREAHIA